LTQISNPALIPPGGLAGPTAPAQPGGPAPAERNQGPARQSAPERQNGPSAPDRSFAEVLKQAGATDRTAPAQAAGAAAPLQFSRHALARIERRGIALDPSTLGRLSEGVGKAASKGSRDSLVLVDGTAFVVSVSNRTVVTAVGAEHMKDNVFTNIDSAVIA
jgi:flagellar operon protein